VNFTGNAVATLFIAWWDRTLDADRVRRVFNGETVEPLPSEDPILPDGYGDIDDDLIEYGHHTHQDNNPERTEPADADSTAKDNRRPAYSETI